MKVLMLGRIGLLEAGGGDKIQVQNTAEELRRLGVEVDIKTDLDFDPSLYDVINKYSRINIVKQYEIRQYSHRLSIEETIVKAIETKEFRTILAMLDLFNKVKDWKKLKKLMLFPLLNFTNHMVYRLKL